MEKGAKGGISAAGIPARQIPVPTSRTLPRPHLLTSNNSQAGDEVKKFSFTKPIVTRSQVAKRKIQVVEPDQESQSAKRFKKFTQPTVPPQRKVAVLRQPLRQPLRNKQISTNKPATCMPSAAPAVASSSISKTDVAIENSNSEIEFPIFKLGLKVDKWDLKAKLQAKIEEIKFFKNHYKLVKEQEMRLTEEIKMLRDTSGVNMKVLKEENETLSVKLESLTENLLESEKTLRDCEQKILQFTKENVSFKHSCLTLTKDLATARDDLLGKRNRCSQLEVENSKYKNLYEEKNLSEKEYKEKLESQEAKSISLESALIKSENVRRTLHNEILELKGNIRVFARIRPFVVRQDTCSGNQNMDHLVFQNESTLEIIKSSDLGDGVSCTKIFQGVSCTKSKAKNVHKLEFSLDQVFPPFVNQEKIFQEISQLVQSVIDGYNVCIFAYGQTGSGKTYTMEGPPSILDFHSERENPALGVIPRAVQQVFTQAHILELNGWEYKIDVSIVEIYNETIRDLLSSNTTGNASVANVSSANASSNHSMRQGIWLGQNKDGNTILSNIAVYNVKSETDVYKLLKKAKKVRATAATENNEHSSRSHSIFILHLRGTNKVSGEVCDGTLNLVDLAGSEKLCDDADNDRKSETLNINKSLSNLGNVIMCLSQKSEHIPYRNSKLTHLLKNSLGGNSKTLMFVNISPRVENLNESVNSLRFAVQVNQCNIGTAKKKVKYNGTGSQ